MNPTHWATVDTYLCDCLIPKDAVLEEVLQASNAAGLPQHNVAPNQGKLLQLLVKMLGARTILEIGTLGGYSTIWLARALPRDGRLITLEANPDHATVAKENIARAGLSHLVDVRVGKAAETFNLLIAENAGPFDFIFIDADKPNNPTYLEGALKLSRPGTIIVGDNVVRNGAVTDETSTDPRVIGIRKFLDQMGNNITLSATAIQTVGSKGYDGFSIARVESL